MNTTIKEATISDIGKGLLDVYIEGYRFHQNGRPDVFANLSDVDLKQNVTNDFEKFKILILLNDEKVVGYLAYDFKGKRAKKLHIDQLIIKSDSRKQGYGKMLINKAKEIAEENGCSTIQLDCWLFNTNAMAMYEHIGFERQRIIYEMKL